MIEAMIPPKLGVGSNCFSLPTERNSSIQKPGLGDKLSFSSVPGVLHWCRMMMMMIVHSSHARFLVGCLANVLGS